jgi:hypothetical protein
MLGARSQTRQFLASGRAMLGEAEGLQFSRKAKS